MSDCLENSRRAAVQLNSLPKTATLHFTPNQDSLGVFGRVLWHSARQGLWYSQPP
jgi:hypothetical protein